MLSKILVIFSSLAASVAAFEGHMHLCGSNITNERAAQIESQFNLDWHGSGRSVVSRQQASFAPFSVYWHVIYASKNVTDGYISDSTVRTAIDATNSHFAGTPFSFRLKGITRTKNSLWFNNSPEGSANEREMKETLHRGDQKVLNIYSTGYRRSLGSAVWPWDAVSLGIQYDGVVFQFRTVPGGSYEGRNEGKVLTHMIGHWLGLYDLWQGGCDNHYGGDYVSDTPSQQSETVGCPEGKDSCPDFPGVDSIHNFMDLSDDSCRTGWTPGQITRCVEQVTQYRQ